MIALYPRVSAAGSGIDHIDLCSTLDLTMELDGYVEDTDVAKGLIQNDVTAIDLKPNLTESFGDVALGDRTEKLAFLVRIPLDGHGRRLEFLGTGTGTGQLPLDPMLGLALLVLKPTDVPLVCDRGQPTRDQKVAGITILDANDVADLTKGWDVLLQNDVHDLLPSRVLYRGPNPRRAPGNGLGVDMEFGKG
jgi:hypothetical protein